MFYSAKLLAVHRNGRFSKCWLAATSPKEFRSYFQRPEVEIINVDALCENILNVVCTSSTNSNDRFSLYLAAQLTFGTARIYQQQVLFLYDEVLSLLSVHSITLPKRKRPQTFRNGSSKRIRLMPVNTRSNYYLERTVVPYEENSFLELSSQFSQLILELNTQNEDVQTNQMVSNEDITMRDIDIEPLTQLMELENMHQGFDIMDDDEKLEFLFGLPNIVCENELFNMELDTSPSHTPSELEQPHSMEIQQDEREINIMTDNFDQTNQFSFCQKFPPKRLKKTKKTNRKIKPIAIDLIFELPNQHFLSPVETDILRCSKSTDDMITLAKLMPSAMNLFNIPIMGQHKLNLKNFKRISENGPNHSVCLPLMQQFRKGLKTRVEETDLNMLDTFLNIEITLPALASEQLLPQNQRKRKIQFDNSIIQANTCSGLETTEETIRPMESLIGYSLSPELLIPQSQPQLVQNSNNLICAQILKDNEYNTQRCSDNQIDNYIENIFSNHKLFKESCDELVISSINWGKKDVFKKLFKLWEKNEYPIKMEKICNPRIATKKYAARCYFSLLELNAVQLIKMEKTDGSNEVNHISQSNILQELLKKLHI